MASAKKGTKLSAIEKKERKQQKLLNKYRQEHKWMLWGGSIVLILVVFLLLSFADANNWGRSDNLRNAGFGSSGTGAEDTVDTSIDSVGGIATNGATKSSTGSNSKETSSSSNTTSTTNNATTTTTNNSSNDGKPSSSLLSLSSGISNGDGLSSITAQAQNLGLQTTCRTDILAVKVCDFSDSTGTITTKSLLGSDAITSVTSSLGL